MSLSGKIETTANVATIVVAILISAVLIRFFLIPVAPAHRAASNDAMVGKNIDGHALGVDWTKNGRTLLLAISTTCHYCAESAPFFRRLGDAAKVKTVAVLPQSVLEGQQYLTGEGVHVDEIKQATMDSMGVMGTPTLLLVNEAGVVTNAWVGKLQPDEESQVLATLAKQTVESRP